MCSMEILAPQEKKKPWFKRIFKLKKNKQKHHQKVPTTTQKRFRVKKSLEVAISEKSPQKAEEILFRFFDVLCPEDMRDLIIKSIIADESECISYPISYSSEYFSQTLLHTIMKCTKHSQFFDDKDWAPIHVAIKLKRAGATMYLLERQPSDINLPTKSDLRPPLHLAVFGGSDIMVRLLIEHGADFKSRDIYGNTALHVAVQTDADSIVELLLDESRKSHNQSIVNEGNNDGWTPLHLAAYRGNTSTCKILLQYGAYIDCQTKSGKTPLHWASIKSNKEVVTLLVEHSADLEATDRSERMPYQYATSKAIKRIIDVGESRRSSKSGSLRKVSIRIDPRSRNYWQVSKARDETNDCEKSVQSDITAMNSREKKSIHEINPRSALLINSFISSIDVLQLPHGMRSNLSEPDLSYKHQPLSPPISKLLKVPVSPVSSLSSFRSLGNSSKASEFYNQHGKKQPFSHGESGIFEQSIQDDESYCAVNKRSPSECQNTSYRSLPPATYEELTTLYRQIKFKAKRRLVPDVNPNFYINNRFLELYTTEAITCIKNPGTAWLSVCQKCSDENEEVMFFVGKMAAFFQDDHKDRCLCQRCVEQLMLFISVFLFQSTHFHQSRTLGTPIRRMSNVLASMLPGFSKRAAYEKFSEKLSNMCSIKRKENSTLGFLLEKIEENKNKLNSAVGNMAQHIKSFVPPDVCPEAHLIPTVHPLSGIGIYEQLSSNQLVDLIVTIIESDHEWILNSLL